MKNIQKISAILLCFLITNVSAQTAYTKLVGGLDYIIIAKGKGELIKDSTFVKLHYIQTIGDSVFFNSYKQPTGPVLNFVQKGRGDINDYFPIFNKCRNGDSIVIRLNKDSLFRGNTPPFVKEKDEVLLKMKIVEVFSKKQRDSIFIDDAKKAAEQKAMADAKKMEEDKAMAAAIGNEDKVLQEYIAANKIKAIKTTSGMYYAITEKGTGELPKNGQQLTMNYTGMLLDGTKFDSNVDPAFNHVQPFTFTLGVGQVIRGWDEGIALLPVGTKGILLIPSPMAYGPSSPSPVIKPNSIMRFDVEVISAK